MNAQSTFPATDTGYNRAMNDQKTFAGGCLCGKVRFEVDGPTKWAAHCHCSLCRRAHGAAFVTWVGIPAEQFRITSGEDRLARYETDTNATRTFCGQCGTTLMYEGPRWPGEIHVVRSNFDGDIDRAPQAHVYVDHKASWWSIDDDLPQLGGVTGSEAKS